MRVADYLEIAADRYPQAEALVYGDVRMAYREARQWVHAIANAFKAEPSLSDGAHVAVYSENSHRVPLIQWGANRADLSWLGVHVRNATATNIEVLGYLDCEAIFFSSAYEAQVPALKAGLPNVKLWVCIDRESPHGRHLDAWVAGHDGEFPHRPFDANREGFEVSGIVDLHGTARPDDADDHASMPLKSPAPRVPARPAAPHAQKCLRSAALRPA